MYSWFTSWASKIAAKQIIIPLAGAFAGGMTGTVMAVGGDALNGLPGEGLLSGAASFAGMAMLGLVRTLP